MRITLVAFFSLMLLACGSEPAPTQDEAAQPPAKPAATNNEAAPGAADHTGDDHSGHNHAPQPQNEQGYTVLEPQDSCEKPVVIEFFAYQCPHCYQLEKHVKNWRQSVSDDVTFITIPTDLGREEFTKFVAAHYVAERLGVLDEIKPLLFGVIHERKEITNILDAFVQAGATKEATEKAFQDVETLQKEMLNGFELMKRYKITSVPTVLVNYQYQTDVSKAGGYEKVFNVVNDVLKLPSSCQ
ncbi:MAG: thiol:disulfide interchange protein DsbA/DsbL [Gammaproteobacteria bacterium]|nr:thiol:disulfide interchange protein DsbA/DsbL [Gammaproteobacteria bacterium]